MKMVYEISYDLEMAEMGKWGEMGSGSINQGKWGQVQLIKELPSVSDLT